MLSKTLCPKCRSNIPLEDTNVATDIALCRRCGETWKYSELIEDLSVKQTDLANPPKGAWFKNLPNGFEVGATTRSGLAIFLVPFMCVWSGFSLGAIYGTQIAAKKFNLGMSLFGIPFMLGTIFFGSSALMSVCGKVYVRVEGDDALIFTGIGPIGWRRRFKWSDISSIRTTEKRGGRGGFYQQITLDGKTTYNCASSIKDERRKFIVGVLQKMRRNSGR